MTIGATDYDLAMVCNQRHSLDRTFTDLPAGSSPTDIAVRPAKRAPMPVSDRSDRNLLELGCFEQAQINRRPSPSSKTHVMQPLSESGQPCVLQRPYALMKAPGELGSYAGTHCSLSARSAY